MKWHKWGEPLAAGLNLLYTIGYMQNWAGSFVAAGIGSVLFAWICWQKKLLAEAGLWAFYVGFALYGWWNASEAWPENLPVPQPQTHLLSLAIAGVGWAALARALRKTSKADLPIWDAFTTVGSLLATFWMVQFVHANWLYWMVVDAAAIGLYLRKKLRWGALLMIIYTLLAIEGYWDFLAWI